MTKLRLAIVGAGPAGIYAADILLKAERKFDVSIDLFEQLPAPYGLVRYGVAPDHPRIKGIVTALREVLDRGDIRLFGNVRFGEDITLEDLKRHYNAVIFATGAIRDAGLDIPGIDAIGSYGAADFVSWFDGHPDVPREWPLDAASVAVIGNGNVALDVSRMLAKHAEDLLPTEVPDNVYAGFEGQRGHRRARLRPPGARAGEVHAARAARARRAARRRHGRLRRGLRLRRGVEGGDRQQQAGHGDRPGAAVVAQAPLGEQRRRRGIPSPAPALLRQAARGRIDDDGRVSAFRWERTRPDGEGGVAGTGEIREVPIQALYRAVGYFGSPLPGVPFDKRHGVIPNHEGQALRKDSNDRVPGVYATGWIKRGPVGLIGHTKSDAMETVRHIINDQGSWWQPADPSEGAIPALLAERGVRWTDLTGWHRLDEHEMRLGAPHGRARIKVVPRHDMVDISRGE